MKIKEYKIVLILGAGEQQIPVIARAHRLGYGVACVDVDPQAPGLAMSDYPLPGVSTHQPSEVEVAVKKLLKKKVNVSGIVAVGVEASHTVAYIAEKFGFNAVSQEVARISTNKIERLKCWKKHGVPCPDFGVANNLDEAIKESKRIGFPVVFKPTNLAGAKGVVVIRSLQEVKKWFSYTFGQKNAQILIEEYLEGTEHSSESLVHNGKIYTTGFTDRNYDTKYLYPPHLLENGDTTPTALPQKVYKKTLEAVESAIRALGIKTGPAKGDILITKRGEPKMLEMATRASGDYFAACTAVLNNGSDLISAILQQAVGDKVNLDYLKWHYNHGVALRYFWPKLGKVTKISGIEEARNLPGVKFVNWEPYWKKKNIGVGTTITKPTCHGERVGCVMVTRPTRKEAIELAEYAVQLINIETKN